MVNIRKFVQETKAKFQSYKNSRELRMFENEKNSLESENRKLSFEHKRAKELAPRRNKNKNMRDYVDKNKSPNKVAAFAKGLAKVVNKSTKGYKPRGLDFGGNSNGSPFNKK